MPIVRKKGGIVLSGAEWMRAASAAKELGKGDAERGDLGPESRSPPGRSLVGRGLPEAKGDQKNRREPVI